MDAPADSFMGTSRNLLSSEQVLLLSKFSASGAVIVSEPAVFASEARISQDSDALGASEGDLPVVFQPAQPLQVVGQHFEM